MTTRLTLCTVLLLVGCTRDNTLPPDGGLDAGSDGGGGACKTLDEAACNARLDCVADTCFTCSCTPSFLGCRRPSDGQAPCPELGCASPLCCRSMNDCKPGFATCEVPPLPHGCGACFIGPGTCAIDDDCKGSSTPMICEPATCACDQTIKACRPACTGNAECREPEVCGADGRCRPRPCSDAGCTGNYACGSGGSCERKSCVTDAQCARPGYCVEGRCSRSVGQCVLPAA